MLSVFKQKPGILIEAQKAKFKPSFIIQILIFIALFLIISIAQSVPIVVVTVVQSFTAAMKQDISLDDPSSMMDSSANIQSDLMLLSLLVTGIATILIIIYCRFIEKRSLYSMGFNRKKAFLDYAVGLAVGLGMFSVSVLISFLTGSLQYDGFVLGNGIGLLLCFFIGFIIQGMSEEVILRGYFMMSVAAKNSILLAVLANSIIFALLHLTNPGVSILGMVNLILFGLFASVYALKMNSIWGICAIHSIWNFAQGNIYGIRVSGMDTPVSLFSFLPKGTSTLINGGAFGLEGGLAVTIVLLLSTLIVLRLPGKDIQVPETGESENTEMPQASAS